MNQWRNRSLGAFIAVSLFLAFTLEAQETNAEKAVFFLAEEQEAGGNWNREKRKQTVDTLESFLALQRVRGGEAALNNALKYFSALEEDTNENLSSKLLILSNSTANVTELATKLISRQKQDGGWGLVDSKRGAIPDTILAINALIASQKSSASALNSAGDFLLRSQQASGAWIFSDELSLSDTIHTAQVLIVLQNLRESGHLAGSGLEQAMSKAQKFLEDKASGNGSYGTLLDTAWTYLAFSRLKQPSELQQTLSYINGQQQANGSWNNLIYDTAICLQALSAIQAPQTDLADLEITEQNISFTPQAPLTGNQVTITATVSNIGKLDAKGVKVEFFNGDPRLGGTSLCNAQAIDVVAGGVAVVTGSFVATDLVGTQQIVVFIDRDNAIQENSKANNVAAKLLSIGGQPDLQVTTNDITLSNPNPKAFETVDLIVTIHNIGNETVTNIPIQIFDNNKELASLTLEGVNAGSSNKAIITTGFTAETHEIRVVVTKAANEIHEANNTASRSFIIESEPEKPADIAVESIVTNPLTPLSTEPAAITVNLVNLGGIDITTAFNVVLSVDGAAVGTITVPQLLKGQRASLSFENLTLVAGERTVTAAADGANVVTEDTNRTNNTLTRTVTVKDSATPAELELVSVTATPSTVNVDAAVTFKVQVRNNGTAEASNVEVKLFNGTTALGHGIIIPKLVGGQSGELLFEYAFDANGSYTIRAVVDPNNKIAEPNESNNEKSATVTVAGAADLEITASNIQLSADPVGAFEQFTITAVVKNLGNQAAVNVPVRFLADGKELATLNLSGVNAGGSNRAILTASLPKGAYNITVQVDPDKTLSNEHNYINNTAFRTLTVNAPATSAADIAVEKLEISPALPIQNTETVLKASIINQGGTDIATPFTVEFKDGETVLHTFTIPALMAGQRSELNLTANLTAGDHTITVTADAGNVVAEASETNNTATRQVSVKSDATPADLSVASITMDKATANVLDDVIFTAAIYNGGTTTAENFFIRILINGETFGEDYKVTSLPGGSTFNLQIPYQVVKEGANVIQVIADAQNHVTESDETNNAGTFEFNSATVARPDLTIPSEGGLMLSGTPQPGVPFDIQVKISNIGNEASAACKLLVTQGNPQTAGNSKLAEVEIPAIAVGASATVKVRLTFTKNVENLFFHADSDNTVIESNENNNLIQTSLTVTALPDLFVNENSITLSHTDISKGSTVEIKVLVANLGSVDSTATKLAVYRGALDAADKLLLGTLDIPAIKAGASHECSVLWNPAPGEQKISVVVDPENIVNEASETNNTTVKDAVIEGAQPSVIKLFTVPADGSARQESYTYGAYQDVEIELTHFWGDNCKPYLFVLDSANSVYSVSQINGKYYWNTGNAAPGTYKIRLIMLSKETTFQDFNGVLTEIGILLEESFMNFQVTASQNIQVTKVSTAPAYTFSGKTEKLNISCELLNHSNTEKNLTATRRLKGPDGTVLQTEDFTFSIKSTDLKKEVALGSIEHTFTPAGTYTVEVEIFDGNQSLAKRSIGFPVLENVNITVKRRVEPPSITPEGNTRVKVIIDLEGTEQIQGN